MRKIQVQASSILLNNEAFRNALTLEEASIDMGSVVIEGENATFTILANTTNKTDFVALVKEWDTLACESLRA